MDQSNSDVYSSRSYKLGLTIAILLLLATLTAVVILIIIGNARAMDREAEFKQTLTAAFAAVSQTKAALVLSPTPAPPVTVGEYPFALADNSPAYASAPTCEAQILTGQVLDRDGAPSDGFTIKVWGDFSALRTLQTGEIAQQAKGRWTLSLTGMAHRRLWVQLTAGDRYFSAPVELVFGAEDCARNQAEIIFRQIAPLN